MNFNKNWCNYYFCGTIIYTVDSEKNHLNPEFIFWDRKCIKQLPRVVDKLNKEDQDQESMQPSTTSKNYLHILKDFENPSPRLNPLFHKP